MSFELPDLDSVNEQQLLAELIRRIPMFTPLWTDFNDSDPGITLLQLLCWIGESLLYQTNAIPIETQRNFLRWILGLAFSTNQTAYATAAANTNDFAFLALRQVLAQVERGVPLSADDLQRAVLTYRRAPSLALTLADVTALAYQANQVIAQSTQTNPVPSRVLRADALVEDEATALHILSDAKPSYQRPPLGNPLYPDGKGVLRRLLLLQPATGTAAQAASSSLNQLLTTVTTFITPRVLLGSRVTVAAAQCTPINLGLSVLCPPQTQVSVVLDALIAVLFPYFLPARPSWTYGQAPVEADLRQLIQAVPGVSVIDSLTLTYIPTPQLPASSQPGMAQLGVTTLLAALPDAPPALLYAGLPLLRCLDLRARAMTAGEVLS